MPSSRVVKNCGLLWTHGWSGAACSARSRATSSPRPFALATNASKSSMVPRSGWTASCPPSLEPMAQGLPGSSGPGVERVVRALAVDLADRVDRRQVDDVEAHLGHGVQAVGRRAERAADRLAVGVEMGALAAREELVPAAEQGALAVGVRRVGALDGDQLAHRVGAPDLGQRRVLQDGQAGGRGTGGVTGRVDRALQHPRLGGVGLDAREHRLAQHPALGEHQVHVDAGRDLQPGVVLPGGQRVRPGVDLEGPRDPRRRG